MPDLYKEIVLKNCEESMVLGDDGFFMFAPKENNWYSSHDLTIIAEELMRRNKNWVDSLEKYLDKND
jgi:hypothetical protein